ncbi:enoyl-CoA hydratase/isomerase family protein [Novosphingobium resinovorum]|uniref:enoyl-CoA hydratase/isomerase family protein n=1 Tax=Novosphingobium resinovorum TaxID=158500 RepID=UPI002ED26888|nr:enoyl-CoA hydratase/isomerase family protein [Novosphingobium resinovorum]
MGIEVTREGAVAVVRFARPDKLNAMTLAMYDDLGRAFDEAQADGAVHAIALLGSERAFCAGADLLEAIPALAEGRFDISEWDGAHAKKGNVVKPIVSGVRGLCYGAGFEIMLASDIRVAGESARFRLPEAEHGFVPAGGTLVRLVRQIAYAHAMEIMLTARVFTAPEMLQRAVVNEVVADEAVDARALELAGRIAAFSPVAVQTIKEAALTLRDMPLAQAFAREAVLGQRTFTSPEARAGLDRFARRKGG